MNINKEEAKKDLDKLYGNGLFKRDHANLCYGDGYYALSLKQKYGMELDALAKEIGYDQN